MAINAERFNSFTTETNRSNTNSALYGSKFPVGSSARIRAGDLTKALAIATLCCYPPDNSDGK